jgi:inosine-uridine nucleoside N-ribohydrolase
MALLLALASPELEVLGVTTVHGNQTVAKTTANALRVLEFAGFEVPVARGAEVPLVRESLVADHVHGESGLDGPDLPPPAGAPVREHAIDFLAERLLAAPAPVTLIPTGPLTNVALLLAVHPQVAERIERVVLMGGAIAEGNRTPAAEFNVWADPEAAARVFESGLDVTMVGLDVTHRALLKVYNFPGTPVHDAMAVAHVIDGALLTTQQRHVAIDCESSLCRGRTVVDLWKVTGQEPNAAVAVDVHADAFLELLVGRIASLA